MSICRENPCQKQQYDVFQLGHFALVVLPCGCFAPKLELVDFTHGPWMYSFQVWSLVVLSPAQLLFFNTSWLSWDTSQIIREAHGNGADLLGSRKGRKLPEAEFSNNIFFWTVHFLCIYMVLTWNNKQSRDLLYMSNLIAGCNYLRCQSLAINDIHW